MLRGRGITAYAALQWLQERKRRLLKEKVKQAPLDSIEFQLDCMIHTTQIEEASK